jgi:hypothetical protein
MIAGSMIKQRIEIEYGNEALLLQKTQGSVEPDQKGFFQHIIDKYLHT